MQTGPVGAAAVSPQAWLPGLAPPPPAPRGDAASGAARTGPCIRDLPEDDRPRQRLAKYGAGNLSTAELLAIVWRTGSSGRERESALSLAQRGLSHFGSLARIARASA